MKKPRSFVSFEAFSSARSRGLEFVEQAPSTTRRRTPFCRLAVKPGVSLSVRVPCENDQIWNAAGMPSILDRFFDKTSAHIAATSEAWVQFVEAAIKKAGTHDYYSYAGLQQRLRDRKISFVGKPPAST